MSRLMKLLRKKSYLAFVFMYIMMNCLLTHNVFAASKKISVLVSSSYTYYGKEYGTMTVKYRKNGLVSKYDSGGNAPVGSGAGFYHNEKYTYNKNNKIKKVNVEQRYQPCGPVDYKQFYDKKGRVKRVELWGLREWEGKIIKLDAEQCKYNKKGQLVKKIRDGEVIAKYCYKGSKMIKEIHISGTSIGSYEYKYDKKGNIIESTSLGIRSGKQKNYYKRGKLIKRVFEDGYAKTYTYKTIKVKKNLVKKIKAQQWALLNNNRNFALGVDYVY